MKARIGRLWPLGRGQADASGAIEHADQRIERDLKQANGTDSAPSEMALTAPTTPQLDLPEQPVLLTPSGDVRPVRVGELLPVRRRPWPLSMVRLPAVPKRAILAAGVCAGLAAPGIARHLATRVLLGAPAARANGILEITRITYRGPLTPHAATAIGRALEASRR